MPIINGYEYSAEEAIAADYCPECGADFRKVNPHAHRLDHWRQAPPSDATHNEGRKRIKLFDDYLRTHPPLNSDGVGPKLRAGAKPAPAASQEAQS